MADKSIIDPERLGTWTAGAFVLALLALVVGILAIYRVNAVLYGTQIEVLGLNKKIESLRPKEAAAPTAAPAQKEAPAPATAAPMTK